MQLTWHTVESSGAMVLIRIWHVLALLQSSVFAYAYLDAIQVPEVAGLQLLRSVTLPLITGRLTALESSLDWLLALSVCNDRVP